MKYVLDTNIISYAIRNRDKGLMAKLAEMGRHQVCTSVLVKFELEYGGYLRDSAKLWASIRGILGGLEILPLIAGDSEAIARLAAELRSLGTPIGPIDTLIAGHVLARGFTLVTHNTKHFSLVKGLRVEDWCEA